MRPWGLSLVVAGVAAAGFSAGLHSGESIDVDCTRASPGATRCVVNTRVGIGAFIEASTHEVELPSDVHVEWSEDSSRHGTAEYLTGTTPGGRDRSLLSSRSCALKPLGQSLEVHARDADSATFHAQVAGHLGAMFLLALASLFLVGAVAMLLADPAPRKAPTAVEAPEALRGKTLLDVAGLLRANDMDPAWATELHQRMGPVSALLDGAANEEERLRAVSRARAAAVRQWLRHLFPQASAAELQSAWDRAGALDQAATRRAKKEYGYPGTESDSPPDPRQACPGFSDEVYRYVDNQVMTSLR